jgi:hypothetical protein
MDGFRNQISSHQGTNSSINNANLKSERTTPSQPPNLAVSSLHDQVDVRSDPHMNATNPSIMASPQQNDENMPFTNRPIASYAPAKQIDLDYSPQRQVQLSSSFPVSRSEQRISSSTLDGTKQGCSLGQDSGDSIETSLSITTFKALGGLETIKLITPSLTERSGNSKTSKGIPTAGEVQKLKGEITPKMYTRTNHHGFMDGAIDGSTSAAVSNSPAKPNISSTTIRTPQLKHSVSPESPTEGCSPKCFSPSKRLHNLLHGGSRMDKEKETKGERSSSPDPAHMKPDEKREWKQMWANRLRDLRRKEEAEIDEYKAKNPLPNKANWL